MISVPTDNYFALLRAAQLQAARTGIPSDAKQSVPIAVEVQATVPAPQIASIAVSRIIDVQV